MHFAYLYLQSSNSFDNNRFILECFAVGPDYQKPEVKTPDTWYQTINVELSKGSEASIQTWWQIFADTTLNNLIEQARQSNLDLQTAFSRVLEARAALAVVTGERWPTIGADGSVSSQKLSDDGVLRQIAPPMDLNLKVYSHSVWMQFGR